MNEIKIVLGSGNSHKYREFEDFFVSLNKKSEESVELLGTSDFGSGPGEIDETGSDYLENALIKARAWASYTNLPVIADDSGLEVYALGWKPGLYSSRVTNGSDADKISWLLARLAGENDRKARFVACLVITLPPSRKMKQGDYFSSRGVCWGKIARFPIGNCGFGYDPVFVPDGYEDSFGTLGPAVKSNISHRAIAMRGIAFLLPSVIKYFLAYCG